MTYPAYPTLPTRPDGSVPATDSAKHGETAEDTTHRTSLEGGYVATRPKHTRAPRRMWKQGYRDLHPADKVVLDDFFDEVTGAQIFTWVNPENGLTYYVRFKAAGFSWTYVGVGTTKRWNCDYELEQA